MGKKFEDYMLLTKNVYPLTRYIKLKGDYLFETVCVLIRGNLYGHCNSSGESVVLVGDNAGKVVRYEIKKSIALPLAMLSVELEEDGELKKFTHSIHLDKCDKFDNLSSKDDFKNIQVCRVRDVQNWTNLENIRYDKFIRGVRVLNQAQADKNELFSSGK